jgi:hypothetical protein
MNGTLKIKRTKNLILLDWHNIIIAVSHTLYCSITHALLQYHTRPPLTKPL